MITCLKCAVVITALLISTSGCKKINFNESLGKNSLQGKWKLDAILPSENAGLVYLFLAKAMQDTVELVITDDLLISVCKEDSDTCFYKYNKASEMLMVYNKSDTSSFNVIMGKEAMVTLKTSDGTDLVLRKL